jgi:hypothetical protein
MIQASRKVGYMTLGQLLIFAMIVSDLVPIDTAVEEGIIIK